MSDRDAPKKEARPYPLGPGRSGQTPDLIDLERLVIEWSTEAGAATSAAIMTEQPAMPEGLRR
jgi:hypothetical protein